MGRLPSLQIARFLAALSVVWLHATSLLPKETPPAWAGAGVDLFFVLSGFVISHARDHKPGTFLRDRVIRIYPIYWLWAVPFVALSVFKAPIHWTDAISTVTLWPAFAQLTLPIPDPAWSLCFEVVFYLAVWSTIRGIQAWIIVLVWAAMMLANFAIASPILRFLGCPMISEFLLGVLAYRIGRKGPAWGCCAIGAGCLVLAITKDRMASPLDVFTPALAAIRSLEWGAASFLIICGFAQLDLTGPIWKPIAFAGDASFSIYLGHELVLMTLHSWTSFPMGRLGATCVAVAVGIASYWLVERPLLTVLRRMVVGRGAAIAHSGARLRSGASGTALADQAAHP
jgi:peptidoglycan/LPS O-acetylase OafA/YrhL